MRRAPAVQADEPIPRPRRRSRPPGPRAKVPRVHNHKEAGRDEAGAAHDRCKGFGSTARAYVGDKRNGASLGRVLAPKPPSPSSTMTAVAASGAREGLPARTARLAARVATTLSPIADESPRAPRHRIDLPRPRHSARRGIHSPSAHGARRPEGFQRSASRAARMACRSRRVGLIAPERGKIGRWMEHQRRSSRRDLPESNRFAA